MPDVGYVAAALGVFLAVTFTLRAAPFLVVERLRESRAVAWLTATARRHRRRPRSASRPSQRPANDGRRPGSSPRSVSKGMRSCAVATTGSPDGTSIVR